MREIRARAGQPGLEAARRLFAAETMRNGDDEGFGHAAYVGGAAPFSNREQGGTPAGMMFRRGDTRNHPPPDPSPAGRAARPGVRMTCRNRDLSAALRGLLMHGPAGGAVS